MADVPGTGSPAGGAAIAPGGVAPAQTQPSGASAADAPPSWFQSFVKDQFQPFLAKTDEKFGLIGKDFGKLRSKFRDDEPAAGNAAAPDASAKPADDFTAKFQAAQRFGEISSKLPEAAKKNLNDKISAGMSYQQATEFAELVLASIPSGPSAASAGATTPGIAASAAPIGTDERWTQRSLTELSRKDPAKYAKVCDEFGAKGISLFSLPLQ